MTVGAIIIIFPSLIMAWYLQKKTSFEGMGNSFIENEFKFTNTLVAQKKLNFGLQKSTITISTLGEAITVEEITKLESALIKKYNLYNVSLIITPLKTDTLKLSELEDKFVTKAELFKRDELELETLAKNKITKLNAVNIKLKTIFPKLFVDAKLVDNEIHIIWQQAVGPKEKKDAERFIDHYLNDDLPVFIHKF